MRDLALLKKMRNNLKEMDIRKQLDGMLHEININIDRLTTYRKSEDINWEDNVALSDEIEMSGKMLSKIRNSIQECIKRHTELYLMGQHFDELIANIQIFKIQIPNLDILKKSFVPQLMEGVMRAIIRLIDKFFFNYTWAVNLRAFLVTRCTLLSYERNVLEGIKKFRLEMGSSGIVANLRSLLRNLLDTKEIVRDSLEAGENPFKLNILMKAYRDYRVMYEESRADPENHDMTDEQLHKQVRRFGASVCIQPIMGRFQEFSKSEAWELIDAIHRMVIQK